jgi:hypothetical protein
MTVCEHQLQFDLDACRRLADGLKDIRRRGTGPERLLHAIVAAGLDERALIPAAALVLELDQPNHNHQEDE